MPAAKKTAAATASEKPGPAAPKTTQGAAKTAKSTKPQTAAPQPERIEPVGAAMQAGQDTVDVVVKTGSEVAQKGVEKAVAIGQDQVKAAAKASADAYQTYETMFEFSKSNIDAMVKTNDVLTNGVQAFNSAMFKLMQSHLEQGVDAAQKMMGCGNIAEVIELQTELAKSQYKQTVEESRKLSALSFKTAEEMSKPLTERIAVTVETMSKPIAA